MSVSEIQPWHEGDLVEFRVFDKSQVPPGCSAFIGKIGRARAGVEAAFKDEDGIWRARVSWEGQVVDLPAGQVWRVLNPIEALAALA